MYFKNNVGTISIINNKIVIETPDYLTTIVVKDIFLLQDIFNYECYKLIKLDELTK